MSPGTVYTMALAANLLFSTSSLLFSHYSRKFSPFWMNQFKVTIAIMAFLVSAMATGFVTISPLGIGLLVLSGLLGLCMGDLLLFRAFAQLGPGRTLMLFSFQPLFLGLYGWLSLGQGISPAQLSAVLCMVICLFIFVLERNRLLGHWDLRSFIWAFGGILLDAIGVMLTRSCYEFTPGLEAMQVNLIRCAGAIVGFVLLRPRSYPALLKDFKTMPIKERALVVLASLCGTFLSLTLYLTALKHAHLASLTAVAITGPVWVSLLECAWAKKWPNRYQGFAFIFFILGFYLMT